MTITTHWVDTTWGNPGALRDPVILALLCQVSEALGEPRLIYPRSRDIRAGSVAALAVAIHDERGPVGVRGFTRRAGRWHGAFSHTHDGSRRRGVSTALLEHALADLPLVGLEGPFTQVGYRASKALGRTHHLVPGSEPYVVGRLLTPVLPDWSLERPVEPMALLTASSIARADRDRREPWTDLPHLELSPITSSPQWVQTARYLRPLLTPPGAAFGVLRPSDQNRSLTGSTRGGH